MPETQKFSRKKKTKDLPGMPDPDRAAQLAIRLMEADEEIGEAWKEREETEKELIEILVSTGRDRIKVDECLFTIRSVAAKKKISVKKDRIKRRHVETEENED